MDQHLIDFWEANKDNDEFIENLYAVLLEKAPKITTTKNEKDEVIVHLVTCPLVDEQVPFKCDPIWSVDVILCNCMDKK
jgi:hypothetical protein